MSRPAATTTPLVSSHRLATIMFAVAGLIAFLAAPFAA